MKNKPTLKKGIVAASVVAGVAGGLVAGLTLGVPGFAGASSNGVQGTAAAFAKNAVVQLADTNANNAAELPGTITVQGSSDGAADADHAPRGPRAAVASDAVAKVFGMTAEELRAELKSGTSLADVAKAKGVDIEKVKAAITADVKAHLDEEVKSGEHTQAEADEKLAKLDSRLDNIVNGVRPAGTPGETGKGAHGPRGGGRIASDAVAKVFGMTAEELRAELKSGTSLADVAKAKGVDIEKVKAAITADVKAHLDEEVKSGEHTQAEADEKLAKLDSRLDNIVNGVRPAGTPGEMGPRGEHGPRGGHGPRGDHGPRGGMHRDHDDDDDDDDGAQGGSAPTLQGDVQVQPSSANA